VAELADALAYLASKIRGSNPLSTARILVAIAARIFLHLQFCINRFLLRYELIIGAFWATANFGTISKAINRKRLRLWLCGLPAVAVARRNLWVQALHINST
jgi:hypothetical protein